MNGIRFVSFFAGIGGMDLGLERAGWTCVGQVEIDPWCRSILAKHWPHVKRMEDVRDVRGDEFGEFDYIVAGFPCQDVSNAGLRAGVSGSRSGLYREVVRCVRMARPRGVLLENVAALLARGMGIVLGDLAAIGYDAGWDCIPAGALGAHYLRDRVFIVAESSVSNGDRWEGCRAKPAGAWSQQQFEGLLRDQIQLSVPSGRIGRVSDGVSKRAHKLKGLGNAVVPQVAELIGRSIMARHTGDGTV